MTDPVPDPASPPASPPKRRGCFGLATKTVLGCGAFSLGAIVVLVLCLPWLCGGLARSLTEKTFDGLFRGSLAVGDLDLSWWSEQKIQDAVLYDPEKGEVARVSAVLPSLLDLWKMEGPMKVAVTLDADLSADDAGVSNLQRAIEPREAWPQADGSEREAGGSDPLAQISRLDLEANLTSHRLTWSDAETRERGKPFEIRDLTAALVLKPGQPITFRAGGQVVSDTPGALEIESTIHGPIEIGKAWPLGPVDAKVRIEKFSTAMIDGVAGLEGKLVEVIGPTFDLKVAIARSTPQQGGIELDFSSERTNLAFAGDFEGGLLRSRDGSPVRLVVGVPKGFVSDLVKPALPPDMTVSWEEGERPWSVTIANLALPIPEAGMDSAQLARTFDRLVADVDIDLPARVSFENAETRTAGIRAAIDGVRVKLHCAPGEPATAHFETALETGDRGRVVADASIREPWKALADGAIPTVDGSVVVEGVSMRAIDALAGQGGRIAEAIGPTIAIHLEAREASPNSGIVTARVESDQLKIDFRGRMDAGALRCEGPQGLDLVWYPPAGFVDGQIAASLPAGSRLSTAPGRFEIRVRELSVPVLSSGRPWTELAKEAACDLHVSLPGATFASEGVAPMTIGKTDLGAKLLPGGAATLSLRMPIDAGAPGQIGVHGSAENAFLGLDSPFDVKLAIKDVATAPIDAFAGQDGLLAAALGSTLSVDAHLNGSGPKILATVEVETPTTSFRASIEKEGRLVRASGEQGIFLTLRPPEAALARAIGPHLPEGTALSMQSISLSVRELAVELPAPAAPGATPASPLELLGTLACEVRLKLGTFRYADANTRAAKVDLAVHNLDMSTRVDPGKPLSITLGAGVSPGPDDEGGRLAVKATVPDPWFFLRGPDAKLPPIDADVQLTDIPVALVDGLAGKPGIATGLLGDRAQLDVKAVGASPDAGTFRARITSPSTTVAVAARLEKGVVVAVDEPALDVTATLSQAWLDALLGTSLPPGAHLVLVDAKQPLRIVVAGLRLPLPSGAGAEGESASAAAFANASLHAEIVVPDIAYSDPQTAEAKVPAIVRGLKITADLAPGKPPSLAVTAKVDGEPAGEITATVRALDPPALLAEADGSERFRVALDVRAKSVPTGLVDALANQAGLLLDVLGATLDVTLHSDSISMSEGTFTASLESPQAKVTCDRGGMKEGVLYLEKIGEKPEAVLARAGLTPLFSERILGSLVPMMVNLQKPQGSEPVSVAVEELRLPLDADLSKLDALVRVNLGQVTYKLLPGIDSMLGGGAAQVVDVPEIRVPIQKGVASYAGLPIRIAGRDYAFKGTFSLVDKSFKMETQVPLSALGKNVSDKLDSLRGFLDPNMLVPLELRGTWKSPKLRVGDDFLKRVAEDALKKQGGGLLDGLLKKKKN